MLESPAYRTLSLSAHRLLARIEIEMARHGGFDNGKLPVTYTDFIAFGIDRDAVAPAIRECEALGFLEVTERGRGGNAEFRQPNKFRLTFRHTDAAKSDRCYDPTNDWRRIATIEEATNIARQARKSVAETSAKKQNPGRGKPQVSVGKTPTENDIAPVRKTPTTAPVGKPRLLSISRGGHRSEDGSRSAPIGSAVASEPSDLMKESSGTGTGRRHYPLPLTLLKLGTCNEHKQRLANSWGRAAPAMRGRHDCRGSPVRE
jgi:hypothetical protein